MFGFCAPNPKFLPYMYIKMISIRYTYSFKRTPSPARSTCTRICTNTIFYLSRAIILKVQSISILSISFMSQNIHCATYLRFTEKCPSLLPSTHICAVRFYIARHSLLYSPCLALVSACIYCFLRILINSLCSGICSVYGM